MQGAGVHITRESFENARDRSVVRRPRLAPHTPRAGTTNVSKRGLTPLVCKIDRIACGGALSNERCGQGFDGGVEGHAPRRLDAQLGAGTALVRNVADTKAHRQRGSRYQARPVEAIRDGRLPLVRTENHRVRRVCCGPLQAPNPLGSDINFNPRRFCFCVKASHSGEATGFFCTPSTLQCASRDFSKSLQVNASVVREQFTTRSHQWSFVTLESFCRNICPQ
jgi:hypothetical protein